MAHSLPPLPYPPDALEPHIDKQTMEIHHGKHHNAYVTNLNAALEKAPELQSKSIEDLVKGINTVPEAVRTAVRNNGGGHLNHSMCWQIMAPKAGGAPSSPSCPSRPSSLSCPMVLFLFLSHLAIGIAFTLVLVSRDAGVKFFRFNTGLAALLILAAFAFRPPEASVDPAGKIAFVAL